MATKVEGEKLSSYPEVSEVEASDLVPMLRSGQNVNIKASDLASANVDAAGIEAALGYVPIDEAGARAAAVQDDLVDGVTDVAPSQNAVFDAIAGFLSAATLLDEPGGGLVGFSHAEAYATSTLGRKLKQFVDPRDPPFNAVGDGVADDAAALQAALDTLRPVWLQKEFALAYAFGTQLNIPSGGGFVGGGDLIMLTGAGKFDASTYAGATFATNKVGILAFQKSNFRIEARVTMQANAGVRVCSPVAIRECTNPYVDVEVFGFKESQYPLVAWDSSSRGYGRVYAHDCGTSNDTLASMQITGLGVDYNRTGVGNSIGCEFKVTAVSLVISGAALVKYGRQTDGYNDQGAQGVSGHRVSIYAQTVDEPCDIFSNSNIIDVIALNCYYGLKIVHGASHNKVRIAFDNTTSHGIVISGSATVPCADNDIEFTGSRVGDYGPIANVVAAVATDGTSSAFKPTRNRVRGVVRGGGVNMDYAVFEEAGFLNSFDVDASGWAIAWGLNATTAGQGVNRSSFTRERKSYVRAYIGTATTVSNNTTVPFDTEEIDTYGEYNPATGTFTANAPMTLRVTASVRSPAIPATTNLDLGVLVDGVEVSRSGMTNPVGSAQQGYASAATTLRLNQGQAVAIRCFTASGSPITVTNSTAGSWVTFEQV